MSGKVQRERIGRVNAGYFPIPIDALKSSTIDMDLYLIHNGGTAVLYRSKGSAYSISDCDKLRQKGIRHLYIPMGQHRIYQEAMTEMIIDSYEDPSICELERARIVRGSCGRMIEDFMSNPESPSLGETINDLAAQFTTWCTEDKSKFSYLLDMSEHDFYTATHMVNVGVGCGLLGAEILGDDDPMVHDLMLGGLVHDVGKFGVSPDVLNKEGKLSEKDWAMIRGHPEVGANMLKRQGGQNSIIIDMAMSHHERLDGKGYPNSLCGDELSLAVKICTVVDIFDAMTSARPYRGPIPPRVVLDKMREEIGTAIDGEIFAAWERVIERMIVEDPSRAVAETEDVCVPSVCDLMPTLKKEQTENLQADDDDGLVQIRRAGDESIDAELLESDFDHVMVRSDVRFKRSERVLLSLAGESDLIAIFDSSKIGNDGSIYCVFKYAADSSQAA
jgi:HD-GYP domain-containing protein (c-di-GMP phosphodiesterase class II)